MSTKALEETLHRWASELADPEMPEPRRQQIKDWAIGASIALAHLGYDDLSVVADEVWRSGSEK